VLQVFHDLLIPIADEFSGKRAWLDVCQLWLYRNTVLTPTLREACRYCVKRFRENGIGDARSVAYRADGKTRYGETTLPTEWHPKRAVLSIVKPTGSARQLTTFAENALSLVCRSTSTPEGGVEAPVVVLDDGTKEDHYQGVRTKGKLVLTARPAAAVASLAEKHGAIGIITDSTDRPRMPGTSPTRDPEDGPDAVQWNCFGGTKPGKLFGFVLSPRMGRRLRDLIRSSKTPVVVRAEVEARFYPGHSDVVDAVIPGSGDEELWVLSHISEPGAYDNASGCAVSLEIARTLKALVASGRLPPPRRSIRFLFSTEVSGFLPYLHVHEPKLPNVLAGLCIDSVGVDVGRGQVGGEFLIFRAPEYAASFTEHLVAEITGAVTRMSAEHFGEDNYGLFPWRLENYWGNDAFITDPFFDIPTPELSCWPYRYYHTSGDLPEFISPDNLARAGVICATYLHFLACAGPRDAAWLSALTAGKAKTRIADELFGAVREQESLLRKRKTGPALLRAARKLALCGHYYCALEQDAVRQPLWLAVRDRAARAVADEAAASIAAATAAELEVARGLLSHLVGEPIPDVPREAEPPEKEQAERLVPRRKAWRPPSENKMRKSLREKLADFRKRLEETGTQVNHLWPWANGKRSVYEIWHRVRYRHDCPLGTVLEYFQIMARAGYVEMMKPSKVETLARTVPYNRRQK
jgi:hypothetical protein